MTDTLGVDVNRRGLHTLDVDERYETDGSFVVQLSNHGEATHLHLHLDDELSEVARLEAANHYVESGATRGVRVTALKQREWPADTIRGKLKVVVGHGRKKRFVDIVFDCTIDDGSVDIDPELAASGPSTAATGSESSSTMRLIPVVVLGLVAVLLAVGALVATDGIDFALGGVAVLAGGFCAVAAYYL